MSPLSVSGRPRLNLGLGSENLRVGGGPVYLKRRFRVRGLGYQRALWTPVAAYFDHCANHASLEVRVRLEGSYDVDVSCPQGGLVWTREWGLACLDVPY